MYLEVLLIAQYITQIATRLRCSFVTPQLRETAEFVGLHGNTLRCLLLFALYLATLMHTYSLARWQVCKAVFAFETDSFNQCQSAF